MQLPPENASVATLRRFNSYTVRRLRRAGLKQLADDAMACMKKIREKQAALEDAFEPADEALADRDGADDTLDGTGEEASRRLGARKAKGKESKPWTDIFPNTLAEYTAAPVGEEENRYRLLMARMKANLAPDDPLIAELFPRIDKGIADFKEAEERHQAASRVVDTERSARDGAIGDWRTLMDRIYASLRKELGKDAAEKFFKKQTRRGSKESNEDEGSEG